jgi:HD-GYP domain-containing protein (c-di-GMP phosphodiesterase class II)
VAGSTPDSNRSGTDLVVLDDVESTRGFQERALFKAGYKRVSAYAATPAIIKEHLSKQRNGRADLVLFGLDSGTSGSWEGLKVLRQEYEGPVLATTRNYNQEARERAQELGIGDYLAIEECGEEGLELKVETVLTTHRIDAMVQENDSKTQEMFVNILTVMVKILESKDPYTRFHSHSVAKWSRMIGRRKGLTEDELNRLGLAALFHDFGKIGIPDEILSKTERLTEEEFEIMKKHPTIARDLLLSLEPLGDLLPGITHHHERWDGRGYPANLKGDDIPLWARIIALADSYDTMSTRRTYKEPYSRERVVQELEKGKGTQFDPELTEHLRSILKETV